MGGNVFKGKTASIKKEHIEPTVSRYFEELKQVFPKKAKIFNKKHFKYLGSVGKKPVSGDIDFGIDVSSLVDKDFSDKSLKEWGLNPTDVMLQFEKYKKRARSASDEEIMMRAVLTGIVNLINDKAPNIHCDPKKITAGGFFTLFPQFDKDGVNLGIDVQVDIMVGNLELLSFSYHSDTYPAGYKGLMRTQLMVALFKNINITYSHAKGIVDIDTKELITNKPKDMIDLLNEKYGFKISKNIIDNYFKFEEYLRKNLSTKEYESILNIYFHILSHTRVDIPANLHKVWKKLNSKERYETKFLPADSALLESTPIKTYNEFIKG